MDPAAVLAAGSAAVACGAGLALLAGTVLALADAAGSVRHVNHDGVCGGSTPCYRSIQEAVDAADDGDMVAIAPGMYAESVLVVDKGLRFAGPGADGPEDDDPAVHALWTQTGDGAAALTIDARGRDVRAVRVSGIRFFSVTTGVRLVGRRPATLIAAPADLPTSTLATAVIEAEVSGNRFRAPLGATEAHALLAQFALSTTLEGNRILGAGARILGGGGHVLVDNEVAHAPASALDLTLESTGAALVGNEIVEPGGAGIQVAALAAPVTARHVETVRLEGNRVSGAAAEGVLVRSSDAGRIAGLTMLSDTVERCAVGIAVEGVGLASLSAITATASMGPGLVLRDVAAATLHGSRVTRNHGGVRVVESTGSATSIVIGGSPERHNELGANSGPELELLNETGTSVSTSDVLATYNDWGTADRSRIESGIVHRPDDILLGLVTYLPAMGATDAQPSLVAAPPGVVADGVSEAVLTLEALDPGGRPVAEDTLVTFSTAGGTLLRADGAVQAESERMRRAGEWVASQGEQYGAFDGDGYLRSDIAGSSLALTFEAPAVLVRYAQSVIHGGRAGIELDGEALSSFETLGPEPAWIDRLLASGLGPGPHTVTVTLTTGEMAVDLLAVGATTSDGTATARLRSSDQVGFGRVAARAYGANGPRDAFLDVPFTAGQPAEITMLVDAPPAGLSVGGATAGVRVTARDALGRPVPDGTELRLSALRGAMDPPLASTAGGTATAVYRSPDTPGTDTLRVEWGAAFAEATVAIVPGAPASVAVTASRASLPANSTSVSELTIRVRDALGNHVADGTGVAVTTSLGTLDSGAAGATANGVARARLRAGKEPGSARIRASCGEVDGELAVAMVGTDLRLSKTVAPGSAVVPGERVTYTLSYRNATSGPIYDIVLDDLVPEGLVSPVVRTPAGQALERLADRPLGFRLEKLEAGQHGDVVVGFRIDTQRSWGQRTVLANSASIGSDLAAELTPVDNAGSAEVVVLPAAVHTVTLSVPATVVVGGATGTIRADLTDRYGNPARDGTAVTFATDLGTVDPPQTQTMGGVARATFTSGRQAGTATVRALTLEERGATAQLVVAPGPASSLAVASEWAWLAVGGASTPITATVADIYGNGVPALVTFEADRGLLSRRQTQATVAGVATTTLRSSVHVETARVGAQCDGLAREVLIEFRAGAPAGIDLRLDRRRMALGDTGNAVANVFDVFGNPVPDAVVRFDSGFVSLRHESALTDGEGAARTPFTASRAGTGVIRASTGLNTSERSVTVGIWTSYLPMAAR